MNVHPPEARALPQPKLRAETQRRILARAKLGLAGDRTPAANIGRKHPDYGMTVAEHRAAKAARSVA